jgi:hypothetical protein
LGISSFLSKNNDVMDDGSWHHLSLLCGSSLEDSLLSRNIYIISLWLKYRVGEWAKKSIKTNGQNHHTHETKGKAKERPKDVQPGRNQRWERASPSPGRKESHPSPL